MPDSDPYGATEDYREGQLPDTDVYTSQPERIGRYRIDDLLGVGGFGRVFLAWDDGLNRPVAIKVPHARHCWDPKRAEGQLREARTVASLDHPHIVPVFDVGSSPEFPCYVVSKYIDGASLAAKVSERRLSYLESAELVATIAEALHHAHMQGTVHRDVKPTNILVGNDGKPYIVDFGLALRERDIGRGSARAGTVPYMSPEQARQEGHRVDGRSDIFSLGVVFYELLAGRRPFRGDTRQQLLEQIVSHEPRPLLQYDEKLPKELQRICFQALPKRAADRYPSAHQMAEELRYFLANAHSATGPNVAADEDRAQSIATEETHGLSSDSSAGSSRAGYDSYLGRIVPKAFRSFDAHDADFFLQLLPGPRDYHGMPASIRFWKSQIEETDHHATFAVGLIYGPSGCGKSSLVKAGLLPRLSASVITVYVEASAAETERRILENIRKRCPSVAQDLTLQETCIALRRGDAISPGNKVLIVLDQFEHWLHGARAEQRSQLVEAIRQCDAAHLQCMLIVRDDFWVAISRFMRDLEVPLSEGHNTALVDLLRPAHARKVLVALGQAYDRLPGDYTKISREQGRFLDAAIVQLSEHDEVAPIKLSLFVEMLKDKEWNQQTLKEIGGVEGLGVAFLESTFNARRGNPEYRSYCAAARKLLAALVLEPGVDLKGNQRSIAELAGACSLAPDSREFQRLLEILDTELHLISPVEAVDPSNSEQFQLAHDYLVPAVHHWLSKQQLSTWQGRAQMILEQRAAEWKHRQDQRFFPTVWEYLAIQLGVPRSQRNLTQVEFVTAAGRYYGVRSLALLALILLISCMTWGTSARVSSVRAQQSSRLLARLLQADPADVLNIVEQIEPYRGRLESNLLSMIQRPDLTRHHRVYLRVALLPASPEQVPYLRDSLLTAEPDLFELICDAMRPFQSQFTGDLERRLDDESLDPATQLRAAVALLQFRGSRSPTRQARRIVEWLLAEPPENFAAWLSLIEPIRSALKAHLNELAAEELPPDGDQQAQEMIARRRANAAVMLSHLGDEEAVWNLLRHQRDPRSRTHILLSAVPGFIDPVKVIERLGDGSAEDSICESILLMMGGFDRSSLPPKAADRLVAAARTLYLEHPDSGVHSAAEWFLERWQQAELLRTLQQQLMSQGIVTDRNWYIDEQGHTMAILPHFVVSQRQRPEVAEGVKPALSVSRRIAVATKEVTREQLDRFRAVETAEAMRRHPAQTVSINEAREYCNWLSRLARLTAAEDCYAVDQDGRAVPISGFVDKAGYRLPTKSEWMYACYTGVVTRHFFGETEKHLSAFAWHYGNSNNAPAPVGLLRPNRFGLFDMLGNVAEWCHTNEKVPPDANPCMLGGCYEDNPEEVDFERSRASKYRPPVYVGFRVVRTLLEF